MTKGVCFFFTWTLGTSAWPFQVGPKSLETLFLAKAGSKLKWPRVFSCVLSSLDSFGSGLSRATWTGSVLIFTLTAHSRLLMLTQKVERQERSEQCPSVFDFQLASQNHAFLVTIYSCPTAPMIYICILNCYRGRRHSRRFDLARIHKITFQEIVDTSLQRSTTLLLSFFHLKNKHDLF